jgi:hypothetical protein
MLVTEKAFGFLLAALGVQLALNGLADLGVRAGTRRSRGALLCTSVLLIRLAFSATKAGRTPGGLEANPGLDDQLDAEDGTAWLHRSSTIGGLSGQCGGMPVLTVTGTSIQPPPQAVF